MIRPEDNKKKVCDHASKLNGCQFNEIHAIGHLLKQPEVLKAIITHNGLKGRFPRPRYIWIIRMKKCDLDYVPNKGKKRYSLIVNNEA